MDKGHLGKNYNKPVHSYHFFSKSYLDVERVYAEQLYKKMK